MTTVWTVGLSTSSTVTPRVEDATVALVSCSSTLTAAAASSAEGVSIVAVTRTLAASTCSAIHAVGTARALARLRVYAVVLNSSTLPATTAVKETT